MWDGTWNDEHHSQPSRTVSVGYGDGLRSGDDALEGLPGPGRRRNRPGASTSPLPDRVRPLAEASGPTLNAGEVVCRLRDFRIVAGGHRIDCCPAETAADPTAAGCSEEQHHCGRFTKEISRPGVCLPTHSPIFRFGRPVF